jgi:hypothetical protein
MLINGLHMTEPEAKSLSPDERRALLDKLNAQLRPIYQAISFLEHHCPHAVAPLTTTPEEYYKDDQWRSDGAHCEGCGRDFGWYCPDSPKHICDYEYEPGRFNSDDCIHCHMPDERK